MVGNLFLLSFWYSNGRYLQVFWTPHLPQKVGSNEFSVGSDTKGSWCFTQNLRQTAGENSQLKRLVLGKKVWNLPLKVGYVGFPECNILPLEKEHNLKNTSNCEKITSILELVHVLLFYDSLPHGGRKLKRKAGLGIGNLCNTNDSLGIQHWRHSSSSSPSLWS